MRLYRGGGRSSTELGRYVGPSSRLSEVFQLSNIVRGPTFECLIRHEPFLLSACKNLKFSTLRKVPCQRRTRRMGPAGSFRDVIRRPASIGALSWRATQHGAE